MQRAGQKAAVETQGDRARTSTQRSPLSPDDHAHATGTVASRVVFARCGGGGRSCGGHLLLRPPSFSPKDRCVPRLQHRYACLH